MRRARPFRPLLLCLAFLAAGCSTMQMKTDWNRGADFSQYRTFSFKPGAKPRNAVARRSAEYAVQLALEAKGLRQADEGGDLSIFGHFVVDADVRWDTWGYGMTGWYGAAWGGAVAVTPYVVPVGTLVIDLVDRKTNELVWRGVIKDDISTTLEPEEREKKAIRVAKELFAGYPPPRG